QTETTQQDPDQIANPPCIQGSPSQPRQQPQSSERYQLTRCARKLHAAPSRKPPRPLRRVHTWCTGEDSNLRSSKERQIYSLLPLTTRPPVHCLQTLCRTSAGAPEHGPKPSRCWLRNLSAECRPATARACLAL